MFYTIFEKCYIIHRYLNEDKRQKIKDPRKRGRGGERERGRLSKTKEGMRKEDKRQQIQDPRRNGLMG